MSEQNNIDIEERLNSIAEQSNANKRVQVIGEDEPIKKPARISSTVRQAEPPKPAPKKVVRSEEDQSIVDDMMEELTGVPSTNENESEETYEEETVDETPNQVEEEVVEEPVKEKKTETKVRTEQPVSNDTYENDDEFISEGFANFEKTLEAQEEIKKSGKKNSILDSIHVDLNNIEIVDAPDAITMSTIEDIILDDKSTMLVTCCQSSYTAEVSALKNQEINNISNSDVDYYTYMKRLYQTINKHMEHTSVGKLDYGRWLHVTSYFDIDTLLYGIYCQTFPYENKYNITCPECNESFDAIVNNNTLVEMRGQEEQTYAKIAEIVSGIHNADQLLDNSQVHRTKRVLLDESKIIFDIRIPSVYDYLEGVVAKSSDRQLEEYQNAMGLSLFVENVYMPNVLLLEQSKTLKYINLNITNNKGKLLTTVANLSYLDSLQLTDEINNFVEKYRVTYSIRNVTCPHCGHVMRTIPLDMQTVLFNTITRVRIDR